MPTSEDIDAPDALVLRLKNPGFSAEDDEFDKALQDLLDDSTGSRPHEDEQGRVADTDGSGDADGNEGGADADGDEGSAGPKA